jgi:hypothetical protein
MPAGAKRMPLRRLLCWRRCTEALRRGRWGAGAGRSLKGACECEFGMAAWYGMASNMRPVET